MAHPLFHAETRAHVDAGLLDVIHAAARMDSDYFSMRGELHGARLKAPGSRDEYYTLALPKTHFDAHHVSLLAMMTRIPESPAKREAGQATARALCAHLRSSVKRGDNYMEELPNEVVAYMLQFIHDPRDLANLKETNTRMRDIVEASGRLVVHRGNLDDNNVRNMDPNTTVVAGTVGFESKESFKYLKNVVYVTGHISVTPGSTQGLYGILRRNDPQIVTLQGLENLRYIGGNLVLQDQMIEKLDSLRNLWEVDGTVHIHMLSELTTLKGLGGLRRIGGALEISMCEKLIAIDHLNQLKHVGKNCRLHSCNNLEEIGAFAKLEEIKGNLLISEFPKLIEINGFPKLTSVKSVEILDCGVLTGISAFHAVTKHVRSVEFKRCSELASIHAFNNDIQNAGSFLIFDCENIRTLKVFSETESFKNDVELLGLPRLSTVDEWKKLERVRGSMVFSNCAILPRAPTLENISGDLTIERCSRITDLGEFSELKSIGRELRIADCHNLRSVDGLGHLESATEGVSLKSLFGLSSVRGLNNLNTAHSVTVKECFALIDMDSFNGLKEITGLVRIAKCSNLVQIGGFDSLREIKLDLDIEECNNLESVTGFNGLTSIGGDVTFFNCSALKAITGFTALTEIDEHLSFEGCSSLLSLGGLANLTKIGGGLDLEGCSSLSSLQELASLTTVKGDLDLRSTNIEWNDDFKVRGDVILKDGDHIEMSGSSDS